MPDVRIVDLEIIKRFSLAVRQEFADADEVLEALEATLDEVRTVADGRGKKRTTRSTKGASAKKSGTKKSGAKKAAAKKKAPPKKKTSSASKGKK